MRRTMTLLMLAAAAPAAAVDTSEWTCSSCPFQKEYEATAEIGAGYVSDDSAKFGEWNGLDRKGAWGIAGWQGGSRGEGGGWWRYEATELGLDTREAALAAGIERVGRVEIHYDGALHRDLDTAVTPFAHSGAGRLLLPAGWVRAGSTAGLTRLGASLSPLRTGIERRTLGAALEAWFGGKFELRADARRQEHRGTALGYVNLLTSATALPLPVDSVTDIVELQGSWRWASGFLRLSGLLSDYANDIPAVTFDNPFTPLAPDTVLGRISQAPDNQAWQLALDGQLRMPLDGVLSWRYAEGSIEQDDAFLPASTSAVLGVAPPRTRLDGKVDTSHHRLGISLRPTDRIHGRASYRYDRREDRTPPLTLAYVVGDSIAGGTATTQRYSYERSRLDASGEIRLFDWLRLGGGAEREVLERTGQDVGRMVETRTWGSLRFTPYAKLQIDAKAGDSFRRADDPGTLPQAGNDNPLLRKYHLANRNRDFGQAQLSWAPFESVVLSVDALLASDDYARSPLGLQQSDDRRFTGVLSWSARENLTLYLSGGLQRIESLQTGQETSAGQPVGWTARHEDRFRTAGGGLQWRDRDDRWRLTLDYLQARSEGRIEVASDSPLAASGALPELNVDADLLRASLGYRFSERLQLRLHYAWEDYDSADWALDGVAPATISNVLGAGPAAYRHSVHAVGLSFRWRFGGAGPVLEDGEEDEEE